MNELNHIIGICCYREFIICLTTERQGSIIVPNFTFSKWNTCPLDGVSFFPEDDFSAAKCW